MAPVPVESVEARLLFATFMVTTTADSGAGSLRQAIISANAAPNPEGDVDYILFDLGDGLHTITPLSQLPTITDSVQIDATSDLDLSTPTVELNGSSAGAGADGLVLASSDPLLSSFVMGLVINRFSGNGIRVTGDSNGIGLSYIGTNANGTAAGAGNGGHGILIESNNNFASDNIIAFNGGDGVAVINNGSGNDVSINSIFSNGGLGIDLGNDGRTNNDTGDADVGPNDQQNFPIITSVTPGAAAGTLVVSGTINSTPNSDLDIALYSNPTDDAEGQTFLDHDDVLTNDAGNATFSITVSASASDYITATATRLFIMPDETQFAISTSEFSAPFGPPTTATVSEVFVRGSSWAPADTNAGTTTFMEYLEAKGLGDDNYGYRLFGTGRAAPAENPEDVLPWINVNQVVVRYTSAPTGAGVPTPGIILDGQKSDYTVTTVTPVAGDATAYVLTLDRPLGGGDGVSVAPTAAQNGDRVTLAVAAGGANGSNFSLRINVLQGDVSHAQETTHAVLANDFSEVKNRFFKTTRSATGTTADYTAFHDVDGNGSILANDFSEVKKRFFQNLPAPTAAAAGDFSAAGITADLFRTGNVL